MSKDDRDSWWLFVALTVAVLGIGITWMIATKKEVTACEARVCATGTPKLVDHECICVTVPESER